MEFITNNSNIIEIAQEEDIINYSFYILLNIICILFGIIGNILIVSTIIYSKELHTVASVIILNLSLADLIICITSGPLSIIGNILV